MSKKYLITGVFVFGLLFLLALNVISDDAKFLCGDADSNLAVNLLDITFIIAFLYMDGPAPDPIEAADVNLDGNVNLLDITYLINYLYKDGPAPCEGPIPEGQIYIFDVWHENHAWFDLYFGFYINNEGIAYWYDRNGAYWSPADPNSITPAELEAKYSPVNYATAIIDMDTLYEKFALIAQSAEGPLSPPVTACFDYGFFNYFAYQYDRETGNYIPILLHVAGDVAEKNMSPAADSLFEWLKTIKEEFSNPDCTYPD